MALRLAVTILGCLLFMPVDSCYTWLNYKDPSNNCTRGACAEATCIQLPITPSDPDPSQDLFTILSEGLEQMDNYTYMSEGILLLGNTGAGKSTVAQIIAGNLSQIHSVCSQACSLVIVDEEEKIGLPSTRSKTLVPERLLKPINSSSEDTTYLPFYDCPGFDDTRGAEEDIAANFFVNRVTRKVSRVKMLFVVPESSVAGDTRTDYDNMVLHATRFVKNFDKYLNSFGLIVTKVTNIDNEGYPMEDADVIAKIVAFLRQYVADLGSDAPDETTRKKIAFTNHLLETDSVTGTHNNIWFVRKPMGCGPLSEAEIMVSARNKITELYNQLEFVDVVAADDFGFTLSDKIRDEVENFTRTINQQIEEAVGAVTTDLGEYYNKSIKHEVNWHSINVEQKRSSFSIITNHLSEIFNCSLPLVSKPSEFLKFVQNFFSPFKYPVARGFEDFMNDNNEYIEFFDEVTGKPQGLVNDWSKPLKKFWLEYSDVGEWLEYCAALEREVLTYDFHIKELAPPPQTDIDHWIAFIKENTNLGVSSRIEDITNRLGTSSLGWLDHILGYVLYNPISVNCLSSHGIYTVSRRFAKASDIGEWVESAKTCSNTTQININAGHTIYLDESTIKMVDMDLVILAPLWIAARSNSLRVELQGSTGLAYPQASPGREGTGETGTAGCTGRAGMPSGSIFGIATKTSASFSFDIQLLSGNGGIGQKGGTGGIGASRSAVGTGPNTDYRDKGPECIFSKGGTKSITCYVEHFGINGGKGGNGGAGGVGGPASKLFGSVDFLQFNGTTTTEVTKKEGTSGQNGDGGSGGAGGPAGQGYKCQMSLHGVISACVGVAACCGRAPGGSGSAGGNGQSSKTCESPPGVRALPVWKQVIQYRISNFQSIHPETRKFLEDIDTNAKTKQFWNLRTLAQELAALEEIERPNVHPEVLVSVYSSFIRRLEQFSTETYDSLPKEHQKVIMIFLAGAYSTLMNLEGPRGFGVIVDITKYFEIVKQKIQRLENLSAVDGVLQEKKNFQGEVQTKIDQCVGYIDNVVNPALSKAESDMSDLTETVQDQLDKLVLDARANSQQIREQLRQEEQKLKSMKKMSIFGSILGLFSMVPKVGDVFSWASDKLKEKYEGQQEKVARLDELAKEAGELLAEQESKRKYFITEFVPLVEPLLEYFRNVSTQLANNGNVSIAELSLTKWQLKEKLLECKNTMEGLKDAAGDSRELVHTLEKIMDTMTMSIDLYELIGQYVETQSLAEYIANVYSATLNPIEITDPEFKPIVANYDRKMLENMLTLEVKRATFAFKQWVFPFAIFYLNPSKKHSTPLLISNANTSISIPVGDHLKQVQFLLEDLERYKASTVGGQDTYIIQTNFSSGLVTSKPFFTWYSNSSLVDIEKLMSGEKVEFLADVRSYGLSGRDAIKFKLIEINFRLENVTLDMQREFDGILEHFGVSMTHTGVSSYRFLDEYYLMNGVNQTIIYNFERDASGNRLGTNLIYDKFKGGDLMLSPYTRWIFSLTAETPRNLKKKHYGFDDLKRFAKHAQLELVGIGTYVKGAEAQEVAGGNLYLDDFYDRDTRPLIGFRN